ncbi:MAG TPA: DNA polymerase III subunit beta, partial [Candidatus Bathyarchaeia archaeon]|nr:DNA polymerase III subunit beta [Candidatus Bathyarchaeia archaeon]
MKVKIAKENLLQGIMTVQNIVSSRATLPILSNMLLDTRRDIIKLNTTDLDIGISCELPVETIEEG